MFTKLLRTTRKVLLRIVVVFFLRLWGWYGYSSMMNSNESIMTSRKDAAESISLKTHEDAEQKIAYATLLSPETGEPKKTLLLLHDSGTTKYSWRHLITQSNLTDSYKLVAVDRPGYGNSRSSTPESLQDQVERIQKFVMKEGLKDIILIGDGTASYLVMQLLAQYGNDYLGGISISGRFNHRIDASSIFDDAMRSPYISWIFPPSVRQAGIERQQSEVFLKKEFEATTENIDTPVLILHGGSDMVLSASHARYLSSYLSDESTTTKIIKGKGHISPKKKMVDLLADEIVEFVDKL